MGQRRGQAALINADCPGAGCAAALTSHHHTTQRSNLKMPVAPRLGPIIFVPVLKGGGKGVSGHPSSYRY